MCINSMTIVSIGFLFLQFGLTSRVLGLDLGSLPSPCWKSAAVLCVAALADAFLSTTSGSVESNVLRCVVLFHSLRSSGPELYNPGTVMPDTSFSALTLLVGSSDL